MMWAWLLLALALALAAAAILNRSRPLPPECPDCRPAASKMRDS